MKGKAGRRKPGRRTMLFNTGNWKGARGNTTKTRLPKIALNPARAARARKYRKLVERRGSLHEDIAFYRARLKSLEGYLGKSRKALEDRKRYSETLKESTGASKSHFFLLEDRKRYSETLKELWVSLREPRKRSQALDENLGRILGGRNIAEEIQWLENDRHRLETEAERAAHDVLPRLKPWVSQWTSIYRQRKRKPTTST